jgi:hypothetical protein
LTFLLNRLKWLLAPDALGYVRVRTFLPVPEEALKMRTLRAWVAGLAVAGLTSIAAAATFPGNGGTGFGGPVGNGSLTVTDNGLGTFDFSFTAGTNFSGNALILYVDSKSGGVNDTSTLTDTGDPGRTAISGFNSGNPSRTVATFVPGFNADYAITLEPGVFSGLFDLSNPANFPFVAGGGLSGSGTGPFTFSYTRANFGMGPTDLVSFEGTLISTSAYRSNETIGTSVTVPGSAPDTPNAGFNGTTTFTSAALVPEPSSAALLLISAGGLLGRFRRRGIAR